MGPARADISAAQRLCSPDRLIRERTVLASTTMTTGTTTISRGARNGTG